MNNPLFVNMILGMSLESFIITVATFLVRPSEVSAEDLEDEEDPEAAKEKYREEIRSWKVFFSVVFTICLSLMITGLIMMKKIKG